MSYSFFVKTYILFKLIHNNCFAHIFQINVLVNQIVPGKNNAADLLSVLMAGINQILDPWLYILLRHAGLLRIAKHIKRFLCKEHVETVPPFTISKRGNCDTLDIEGGVEVRVICDLPHNEHCESDDSMTSTSHLIQGSLEPNKHFLRSLSVGNDMTENQFENKHSESNAPCSNGVILTNFSPANGSNCQIKRMKRLHSSPAVFSQQTML